MNGRSARGRFPGENGSAVLTALHRKLLRDLMQTKGQAIAIALVLACGVATFVMSLTALSSLQSTQVQYYNGHRFANIFAYLKRAPEALEARLRQIPGVGQVQTRIVANVNLDLPDMNEPATGRLISIPEFDRPMLNDLYLRRGRWIEPGRRGEVLVSEAFASAHDFMPGDTIDAVVNGRLRTLTIVGIALSPEYVYEIREGDLLPDSERFGVLWIGEPELAAAFDLEGAFNSVTILATLGANQQAIIDRVDALLDQYGGLGAFAREDQTSHRFVSSEIEQLRAMAMVVPLIFFAVAAFLLNMVLSRIISTQREQIAALKAFGYSKWEIGLHYLQFVLLIALGGVIIGIGAGGWLGYGLTQMYTRFFRFPVFDYVLDERVVAGALVVSMVVAAAGALTAVRRAVTLPPAEAMRPEPPGDYRPTMLERLGLQRFLVQSARMILRHLERQPVRASLTVLGIAMSVAVLVLGSFTSDVVDYVLDFEYHYTQRQDITVTFVEPASGSAVRELANIPGVLRAEGFRMLPARIRSAHHEERVGILGLAEDRRLFRLMDANKHEIIIPPKGIVLSDILAELLDVQLGDEVTIEVLEQERPVRQVPVAAVVQQFTGKGAWMSASAAHDLMREQDAVSGAHLDADARRLDALYHELKETPAVQGVTIKRAAIESFMETIAENILRMRMFNIIFACIIAFGVVYNAARITLAERSHELATLRVIGFTRTEISAILLGELATLTLVAIPFGLLIGYGFAALMVASLNTEDQRFPLIIEQSTYAMAASVVLIAAVISGMVVRRRVDHLDLVAVLKARA